MYIFGGKDEDNEKLKDFWSFNLETHEWVLLDSPGKSVMPRSGHTACVYNHQMVIFAGIHEITKELDDMATYSFKKNKWVHLFGAC